MAIRNQRTMIAHRRGTLEEKEMSIKQQERDAALEASVRDYVRAGWQVTSRTPTAFALEKREARARIYLDELGAVRVEGPALPVLVLDGRARAWLLLIVCLVVIIGVASVLGLLR